MTDKTATVQVADLPDHIDLDSMPLPDLDKGFIDNATASIVRIPVKVRRWEGKFKTPAAARKAAIDAGAEPGVASMTVNAMGNAHQSLTRVVSKYKAVYNWLYNNTFHMEGHGWGVVPVCAYPMAMNKLQALKAEAEEALREFLPEYDRLREIALTSELGSLSAEFRNKYPSAEALADLFEIEIKPFKTIGASDVSRVRLSADTLAAAAEDQAYDLAIQLRSAKVAAMNMARNQVARILDAERFNDGMIEDAKAAAMTLRGMVEGYDNDPQVLALADLIDKKVCNVEDKESWKAFPHLQQESQKAAATVVGELDVLAEAYADQDAEKARAKFAENKAAEKKKAAAPTGDKSSGYVAGSILADLI